MRIWSEFQKAVFNNVATEEGHTFVQARAGCAKTTTIVESFKYVAAGQSVLMMAFNKDIADELQKKAPKGVKVATTHSYGNSAVFGAFGKCNLDKHRVSELAKKRVGDVSTFDLRRNLAKLVSLAKGNLFDTYDQLDALIDAFTIECGPTPLARQSFVTDALWLLEACKLNGEAGEIDFDDMIWLPVVLNLAVKKFDRVFLDETQDLNAAQIELTLRACATGGRICAVGDDRQAIYAFRGADSRAIPNIIKRLNAKVLPLSVTYRCARSIVEVAQTIVPDIQASPEAVQGEVCTITDVEMKRDAQAGDFILSRANAPLIGLCLGFLRAGKRANILGRDLGANLVVMIKKSGCVDIPSFVKWITRWRATESERLLACDPPRDTQATEDKAECLIALCEGMTSTAQVAARIETLFAEGDETSRITLSTTHKAKGMERDRVFVLENTYRKWPGVEEDNLYYVAVTRARHSLFLVQQIEKDEEL